jgi:hypothetical protein
VKKWRQFLHEHFIPSERNAYQPHFLRLRVVAGILGVILLLEVIYLLVSFVVLPGSGYLAAIFSSVLVEQTNEARSGEQLHGLTVNEKLTIAAQMKADDMATKGYFAHESPDGTTPWHWFREAGYEYAAAGENLAVNFTDSRDVTSAWLRSPTHRANIMNGTYTEIGIATARGMYKGREAIFVVQEFGRPARVARDERVPVPVSTPTSAPRVSPREEVAPVLGATTPPPPLPVRAEPASEAPLSPSYAFATPTLRMATSAPLVAGVNTAQASLLPPATVASSSAGVVERFLASPGTMIERTLLVIATLVLIALVLAVFVHFRVQFPHLILNGFLLLAIIVVLLVLNSAIGLFSGDI